jgi:uncharacterized protein YhaN
MRFDKIEIAGFGCLRDVTFVLSPGLNIFYGPNEVGKSTLQQAIWALLYGFYKGDRKATKETELLERYIPWSGGAYAGSLTYVLDSQKTYIVKRNFNDNDLQTSVSEADTGRDVTNSFDRGRLGRVSFAPKHFGMSEEVFINTCFVRQSDLHRLAETAQAITETVVNLSSTGNQDRSVRRALEILDTTLREDIGSARARTKPLPAAQDKLEKLKREKESIVTHRNALNDAYTRRKTLLEQKQKIEYEIKRFRYLQLDIQHKHFLAQIDKIEGLLSKQQRLEEEIKQLDDVVDFSLTQRNAAIRFHQEWISSHDQLNKATRDVESARQRVADLQRHQQELLERQRLLEVARSIPVKDEPSIRNMEQQWRSAAGDLQKAEIALANAQKGVKELEPIRASVKQYTIANDDGLRILHDIRLKCEADENDVKLAMDELELAEKDWAGMGQTVQDYEILQSRLHTLDYETLLSFKKRAEVVKQEKVSTQKSVNLFLALGSGFALLLSFVFLGIALVSESFIGLMIGAGLMMLAIALGVAFGVQWRRESERSKRADVESKLLASDMGKFGSNTIEELDTSYHVFLKAQIPYERLERAHHLVESKQGALDKLLSEACIQLGLSMSASVSSVTLLNAEQEIQKIIAQLKDLEQREKIFQLAEQSLQLKKYTLLQVEEPLRQILVHSGFENDDLARSTQRFYELCESRRELEKVETERRVVEAQLEKYQAQESQVKSATINFETAETQLQKILRTNAINEPDAEQAFRLFEKRCERAELRQQYQADREGFRREVQTLLDDQTLDQLKHKAADVLQNMNTLQSAIPDYAKLSSNKNSEALERQLSQLQTENTKIQNELIALEERIKSAMAGTRSLAEVEEEIHQVENLIADLEFCGKALKMAYEQLGSAADEHHRDFLPRLNQIVGQNLSRVTGGRYKAVKIDHADLQVRLEVPSAPHSVTPDWLSRGAQEQIYLLLRLGLTELMGVGRERLPLILDDPLVNYDVERQLHSLEFLVQEAQHAQVLIFTKDEMTMHWFKKNYSGSELHHLHNL